MGREQKTIFISHSSKDIQLIKFTELAFEQMDVKPYFAKSRIEGKNPVDKIVEAILSSEAFFVLITPNVVNDQHNRDWVNFEIGVAKANKMEIFVWIDKSIKNNKTYPQLIDGLTDYNEFDFQSGDECYSVVLKIRGMVKQLSNEGASKKQSASTENDFGLIEAQTLAESFIIGQRGILVDIAIDSTEPVANGWIIKGTVSDRHKKNAVIYQWIVNLKGKTVSSYEIKPKHSFIIR